MTDDRAAAYVWDAKRAAERIARFTAGRTVADYLATELLRSAVERQFEIMGEALATLRRRSPELAAEVPDLTHAVAFRNLLIHGYAKVDNVVVWTTLKNQLPTLLVHVDQLLRKLDEDAT